MDSKHIRPAGRPSSKTKSAAVRPAGPARPPLVRRRLVRSARALFAAALLALSGALALPAAAQTPDPVWSAIMTVGETNYGPGYDVNEDEGGSLSDDDFEYSSTTYTVELIELDDSYAVSFRVDTDGLPEEDILTLEIDGLAFPFEDRSDGDEAYWEWDVPEDLSNSDLPIGDKVVVCLRTAAQVCPTSVPSALSVADVSAEEGEDLTFTVVLSPPSTETVTVGWATSGGTATSGTDFTAGTGTLTFAPGVTEQTFTVATIEDMTDENNETFTVTLSNASVSISGATATGTIKNDDAPPLAWFTTMTVGRTVTDSYGYEEEDGVGSLSDADFEYRSTTFAVTSLTVNRFSGVLLIVDTEGLPEESDLTLEINGHEFPFEDRKGWSETSWAWDAPPGLDHPVNDLPVGSTAIVCLRTAGQTCPSMPDPALRVADVSAEEGEDLTFTVVLSPPSTETVTVDWATSEGTATSGTDFTAGTGTLTFAPGVTEQTFTVATIEDMTDENNETFTVTLSNASVSISVATATGTIENDDITPWAWSTNLTVEEIGSTGTFGYSIIHPPGFGSLSDDDFVFGATTPYTIEWVAVGGFGVILQVDPAGLPEEDILTLEIDGHAFPFKDRRSLSTETLWVWNTPSDLRSLPVGSTVTVCLYTEGQVCPSPTPSLSVADVSAEEGEDLTFTATLSAASTETVTVDWATSGGTATSGTDFTAGSGTLTFGAGDTEKTFTVSTTDDSTEEDDETFTVTLSSPTNATISDATATGRIVTPPTLPTLSIADAEATEGSPVTFTATLSATATADVMATWTASIESGDTAVLADLGTTTTGPVMVTAGQTTGTFMVPTAPDATNEGNETFTVTLSSVSSNAQLAADATATGTIVDDDQPTVGFEEEQVFVFEELGAIQFKVKLDKESTVPITVDWETRAGSAEADVDYTEASGTLTFAAGDTEKAITVAITNDDLLEALEEFTVHLSGTDDALVTLGRSSVLGRIIDRDRATITVAEETTVDEDAGTVTLTLTASASATAAYMIDYATENGTAEAGTDYTAASGQVTFPAEETEQTITITVLDDAADEDREDFKVRLSNATAQRIDLPADPARVLIEDNDDPPTVTVADGTATEGDKVEFTVTLSALSGLDVEVDYATTETDPQSAVSGTDFTAASGTLEIEAGNRTGTIEVQTTEDDASESAETFTLTISNPDNATLGAKVAATGTINDDANAAPSFSSSATFDAAENQTSAGTVLATDGDTDDDITGYAITGGADQAFFSIGATSGALTFQSAPNFEDAKDQGTNNTYVVEVQATSGTGTREKTATQTITVTVTDVAGEAPGKPAAPDVAAASVSSLTVSWSAPANVGPAIDDYDVHYREGTSGSWTDGNHTGTAVTATLSGLSENTSYQVQVRATNDEGTGDWSDAGSGTTDANAAPAFSSSSTFDAAENQTAAGTVLATDGDSDDDITGYAITGGADQAFFSIGATSGALTFKTAPNFEDAKDSDTGNDYVVEVQATSGTGERVKTATQTITVTVTDVAGEAPGKPDAPDVAAASVTSLTVTWTAPANAGPAITDYDYRHRTTSPQGTWTEVTGTTITTLSATIGSLAENTSYQVQVRATNDEGTGSWSDSGSGTTDANAAPSFSSSATFDAAENQTSAGTVLATDSDSDDDITGYAITGGADQAFFSVVPATGVLTFDDAPNFEDAKDTDTNNTYVVEVQATSGTDTRVKTATQTITVTVTDVAGEAPGKPDAPTVSAASVTSLTVNWSAPANAGPAITDYDYRHRTTSPQGTWTEVTGTTITTLSATIGSLAENTSYDVQVRATNDEGTGSWSDSGSGATDANAAPAFSSSSTFDAAENQTSAGTVLAADSDSDDDITGYAITGGADQAFFSIGATSGALTFDDAPNFEDAKDSDTDNEYEVTVQATSGTDTRVKTATQTITVTVTDVSGEKPGKPAAPTVSAASVTSLTVNWSAPANAGPAIDDYDYRHRTTSPQGTWTEVTGTTITTLSATIGSLAENTSYDVQVRATNDEGTGDWSDSGSGRTDANAAPAFSSSSTFTAAENQTSAGTVLATDGDTDDDITGYAITGGADQAFFSIGATSGALTFDAAPNFEDAKDSDTDNTYVVTVQATSGTGTREKTATQTITVTVTDVAGEAPGKPNAPDVAAASVTSLTVTWTKPANAGPAITDYDVQYREGTSGNWTDGNHTGTALTATLSGLSENTSYQVQVRATNDEGTGDWSDAGSGTTDANAAPTFSSSSTFDAAENQTSAGTVLATDSDSDDDITGYAITGGADQTFFSIGATSGALTFDDAPNFEDAEDQGTNNTYVVTVEATSGTGTREKTATQTITVTVTDVAGEAPGKPDAPDVAAASVTSLTVSWSAPANAGPAIDDYDVQYREGTTGDWSDGNHTGAATTAPLSGLSENTSHQVQVRATNDEGTGDWSDSGSGTTDANAAPSFSSSATFDAAENQTSAGTVLATDSDSDDDITGYAITGGADQAFFSVVPATGVLTFDDAPNFEDAKDTDTNNTYVVEVQATSGTDTRVKTATQTITVTVTDVAGEAPGKPDAPTVSAASVTSLTVNWSAPANAGPAITDYDYRHRTTSPQGTWTEVTGTTITTLSATIGSLAENTSYDVQVRATNDEGTGSWSDSGSGATDANAAPAFSSSSTFDAAENQTSAGTVLAADSDSDDDITGYAITGGADQAFFSIGATSGALTFDDAPNFEDAKDSDTDNEYEVTVQATSGTDTRVKTATQTITVTVTDVSGEKPGKPAAPTVSAASVTSLTVNWSAPANAGPAIDDYDYRHRTTSPQGTWTEVTGTTITTLSATIGSLAENTSYDVQVRATNDEGTGDWSDSGSGRTDANAAPAFSSSSTFTAAENQTSAGTVLATDGDTDDDITGYAITGGADQAFFSIGATSGALTFDAAPNFEDAKDSDTDNTYVVTVQATSGTGTREKTATQTITVTVTDVAGEAPGKPNAPDVAAASVTSLTVTWTKPANAGPAITDYDVQYREGTSGNWTDGNHTGTALTATLSGLSENTSYQVQVRATNDEGTGDWSDAGSGTTDANAAPDDPDLPADASTTGTVEVGGSGARSAIHEPIRVRNRVAFDTDWFAVELGAGRTYRIDMKGAILTSPGPNNYADPELTLRLPQINAIYDADGDYLRNTWGADESSAHHLFRVTFHAHAGGTYYIAASGESFEWGGYELTVILAPASKPAVASEPPGLAPNVPNPFNPSTVIPYRLDTDGPVRLEIYNLLGQRIRTLVNEVQAAGPYRVRWDARDGRGAAVATGVYFIRLHHPGGVHTRRMLYLK